MVADGLTIYGPRGEAEHISEPSEAARKRAWRHEREGQQMIAAMVGAMRRGLK